MLLRQLLLFQSKPSVLLLRQTFRALSQVIVLLVVELGVSPQIVSQALVGMAKMRAPNVTSALVRSTDAGFKFLNIFFGIQLLVTLMLLFRYGANHLRIQHKA
ncbi:MAG TPA: hypothetical protein DDW50_13180 [Firmicutes bacterium]|nr:hypothetical protein [Bacillota bacterium]